MFLIPAPKNAIDTNQSHLQQCNRQQNTSVIWNLCIDEEEELEYHAYSTLGLKVVLHKFFCTFVKCYFISYLYITRCIKTHSFHVLIFRSIFDILIPFLFVSCRINVDRTYGGVGFNLSMCETYLSSGEVSAPSLRTNFFVRFAHAKSARKRNSSRKSHWFFLSDGEISI